MVLVGVVCVVAVGGREDLRAEDAPLAHLSDHDLHRVVHPPDGVFLIISFVAVLIRKYSIFPGF